MAGRDGRRTCNELRNKRSEKVVCGLAGLGLRHEAVVLWLRESGDAITNG